MLKTPFPGFFYLPLIFRYEEAELFFYAAHLSVLFLGRVVSLLSRDLFLALDFDYFRRYFVLSFS